jgi:hypothetical protein
MRDVNEFVLKSKLFQTEKDIPQPQLSFMFGLLDDRIREKGDTYLKTNWEERLSWR